uniref:Cytidine deaminase n=1 Tax=Ciona savignyi TaxID=51511 RepID=H2YAZ9_CIOSA
MSAKYTTPEELVRLADVAKQKAYCPYSNFQVGAAVVTASGDIFTGCNVENACYPVGVCAERTAICKAVSEGHVKIKAVAVITNSSKVQFPCGLCRQSINEFGTEATIYCASKDGKYETHSLNDLLPRSFGPADLML